MAVEGKLQLQRYAWNSSIVVAMAVALWLLCFSSSRTRAKQNMAMPWVLWQLCSHFAAFHFSCICISISFQPHFINICSIACCTLLLPCFGAALPSSFAASLCSLSFSLAATWQLEHHNSNILQQWHVSSEIGYVGAMKMMESSFLDAINIISFLTCGVKVEKHK
ncbi:hypothetical protein SLEP1_g1277 [Rubroshorea leprosula]|uniref:Uncharacterized protein n=1 Tax=Rubroshorea leprosula TaxID=152421 RepID=A0AAV5HP63_9ROSI|nr:hypothetical protein SLEP1_g1277 [Rubroshorea leprosula]